MAIRLTILSNVLLVSASGLSNMRCYCMMPVEMREIRADLKGGATC